MLACRIDAVEWPNVRGRRWSAKKDRNTFYAKTDVRTPQGERTTLTMHKLFLPHAVEVDHEDRNGLNNQSSNLRAATSSQNQANKRKYKNGTSTYRGVCWKKDRGTFHAQISINGKTRSLGYFTNEEDAARAYDAAALKQFGEFARLNFPQPAQLKAAA